MMKERGGRNGPASASSSSRSLGSTAARALLLLPLGLAFFALILQVRKEEELRWSAAAWWRREQRGGESRVLHWKIEKTLVSTNGKKKKNSTSFSSFLVSKKKKNQHRSGLRPRPRSNSASQSRSPEGPSQRELSVLFLCCWFSPAFLLLFHHHRQSPSLSLFLTHTPFSPFSSKHSETPKKHNSSRPASTKASRAARAGTTTTTDGGGGASSSSSTAEKASSSTSSTKPTAKKSLGGSGSGDNYTPKTPPVREDWALADGGWRPSSFADLDDNGSTLPKLAFITTTSEPYDQIRLWYEYHRSIGVSLFYLFVDGAAATPQVSARLRRLPGVVVVPRDADLKARHAASRVWNETWLSAFFHKPCNHELFVLQSLNMEVGIALAERDGADWLLHIDTDELMYPGSGPEYSLQTVLAAYPASVDTVVFPNYEALPERDDVSAPFDQVTLFKRNYHHVVSDAYFRSYHAVARGNPNYFITYGNGKSAARVRPGLRPNGAHRWYSYARAPREETSDQSAVLHYTYDRFDDLKSRRDRCDCAPTEDDAKRCFILPFDRMAFLAASMKTDAELLKWFRERLVWNDPAVVTDLLKSGLFVRLFAPQMFMRGAEAALASGLGVSGPPDDPQAEAAAVAAAVADPENPRWGSKEVLRGTRGSIAEEDLAKAAANAAAAAAASAAAKVAGGAAGGGGGGAKAAGVEAAKTAAGRRRWR